VAHRAGRPIRAGEAHLHDGGARPEARDVVARRARHQLVSAHRTRLHHGCTRQQRPRGQRRLARRRPVNIRSRGGRRLDLCHEMRCLVRTGVREMHFGARPFGAPLHAGAGFRSRGRVDQRGSRGQGFRGTPAHGPRGCIQLLPPAHGAAPPPLGGHAASVGRSRRQASAGRGTPPPRGFPPGRRARGDLAAAESPQPGVRSAHPRRLAHMLPQPVGDHHGQGMQVRAPELPHACRDDCAS
jgi:hypothetical protein